MGKIWLSLFIALLLNCAVSADDSTFGHVWIGEDATVSEEEVVTALNTVAADEPNPDHIVVLIHGFATPRASSSHQFTILAERIKAEYAKHGKTVGILGVQWDYQVSGFIFKLPGAYHRKTLLARKVGRFGTRRLMLALKERFPNSHVNIMAHSMGCEVAAAAGNPTLKFDKVTDSLGAFEPDRSLRVNGTVLCGADLEYDVTVKGGDSVRFQHGNLIYMTLSQPLGHDRDKILDLRRLLGGRALGSTFPRMTEAQYDKALGSRKLILDNKRIPLDHHMLEYYSEWRLARIIPSLIYYADNQAPISPDAAAIAEVMDASNTVEALSPFLNSQNATTLVYAVWRIEHLLCGGSQHLADGYFTHIGKLLKTVPRKVTYARPSSPCEQVKRGLFPTEAMMERAGAPSWAHR